MLIFYCFFFRCHFATRSISGTVFAELYCSWFSHWLHQCYMLGKQGICHWSCLSVCYWRCRWVCFIVWTNVSFLVTFAVPATAIANCSGFGPFGMKSWLTNCGIAFSSARESVCSSQTTWWLRRKVSTLDPEVSKTHNVLPCISQNYHVCMLLWLVLRCEQHSFFAALCTDIQVLWKEFNHSSQNVRYFDRHGVTQLFAYAAVCC